MSVPDVTTEQVYLELSVECHQDISEHVQSILVEEGALGLEIIDDKVPISLYGEIAPDVLPEKSDKVVVKAYYEPQPSVIDRVQRALDKSLVKLTWSNLPAQDWVKAFESKYKPLQLSEHIWVVPSWEKEEFCKTHKANDDIVLYLDPGMAFGTGQHETTTMCADALYECIKKHPKRQQLRVLDVGTGTGILALIALKLGVHEAVGTEIDPFAIEVAKENVEKNGELSKFSITNAYPDFAGPVFDVVVANILSQPLIELAPHIEKSIVSNGQLFLSGILAGQADSVRLAYESVGFKYIETKQMNDWVLLSLLR